MNFVKEQISHKKLGKGIIIDSQTTPTAILLKVQFKDNHIITLKYPDSFLNNNVCFLNSALQDEALRTDNERKNIKHQNNLEFLKSLKKEEFNENGSPIAKSKASRIQQGYILHAYDHFNISAKQIYKSCAEEFGWNNALAVNFGKGKTTCAYNATPNNDTVWMIYKSNWTEQKSKPLEEKKPKKSKSGDQSSNKKTKPKPSVVTISLNKDIITEQYYDAIPAEELASPIRITFAKNHEGKFFFLGVYTCEFDSEKKVKTCRRIATACR